MSFCYFYTRTAIEGLWIEVFHLDNERIINSEKKRRISIVTIWFLASLLIAIFVPNITVVINYLGALAGAFMFLFPGIVNYVKKFVCLVFTLIINFKHFNGVCLLFYSLDRYNGRHDISIENLVDDKKYKRITNLLLTISVFYITFGTFIMSLVIAQSLIKDLRK